LLEVVVYICFVMSSAELKAKFINRPIHDVNVFVYIRVPHRTDMQRKLV